MLVERSEITIKEGSEAAFSADFEARGKALLGGVPGVNWVKFGRGVENPSKFILLVEWENMDAHKAYNQTEACQTFRDLIVPHAAGATMEHFDID